MYIVVEGKDLAGKSTFIGKLTKQMASLGKECITVAEPFMGHPSGQKIRDFLKEKHTNNNELYLLYNENRQYLWNAVIRPALEAGKVVISDRNFVSSMVYQEDMGMMGVLNQNTQNHPDLIYLLTITHETYLARIRNKQNLEVIEVAMKDKANFDRIHHRYLEAVSLLHRLFKQDYIVVDNN